MGIVPQLLRLCGGGHVPGGAETGVYVTRYRIFSVITL